MTGPQAGLDEQQKQPSLLSWFVEMNKKITNANVPVFILAGGKGTRLAEETHLRPKPMVEIGGIPILVHIMRHYYRYGFTDFVVCAGYKSWDIKQYFLTYNARINHLEIDHRSEDNLVTAALGRNADQENWRVRVVDTGVETMTGARIAQAFDLVAELDPFDNFAVTYGDGLSNHNLTDQLLFHVEHDCIGTVLGVQPLARFGQLEVRADGLVERFLEKPEASSATISGGFFFFKKSLR